MNITERKLAELIPYERNAKQHDETQIANVAKSIEKYGFVQPIVIDKNNVIVIGHCRALAAKRLKLETVPTVSVENLTEDEVNALRIVDNKTNESPWDFDLLLEELAKLDLYDFSLDFSELLEDNMPPEQLDEEDERENVIVSLNCGGVEAYEKIEARLQDLADEIGASVAVKMA